MAVSKLIETLELPRRMVHMSGVVLPLSYLGGVLSEQTIAGILVLSVVVTLTMEFARLRLGFNHIVYQKLTRPYEQHVLAGYALATVGMATAWLLFPMPAAVGGLLLLLIGDPVSGMASNITGQSQKPRVALGSMSVVSALVVAPLLVSELGTTTGLLATLAGALGAALADGYKPTVRGHILDDNLTIPLASGVCITAVLALV